MFRKLLKYDNRSLRKFLLPIYGISIIASFVMGMMQWIITLFDSDSGTTMPIVLALLAEMLMSVASLLIAAAAYGTVIVLAYRYHQSINTDEGYLTFTLPVKVKSLVWAKLLSGFLWMLAGFGVTLLNGVIVLLWTLPSMLEESYFFGMVTFNDVLTFIGDVLAEIFSQVEYVLLIVTILLLVLAWVVWYLCIIYLSLSLGGVIAQKRKGLAGIGMYFAMNFVSSFVLFFVMIIGAIVSVATWDSVWGVTLWLAICAVCMLVLSYVLVIINRYLLKNKLNLQ